VEGSDDCQAGYLYLDNVDITSRSLLINRFMDWAVVTKEVIPTVAGRMVTGRGDIISRFPIALPNHSIAGKFKKGEENRLIRDWAHSICRADRAGRTITIHG